MSDELVSITDKLREAATGHPHAKIPWPHRLLHDAADRIAELEAEKADLMEICKDAIDEVVDWSSYASEYFQEKYDLRGSLRDLRKRLGKYHRDLETAMSKEAIRQAIKEGGE